MHFGLHPLTIPAYSPKVRNRDCRQVKYKCQLHTQPFPRCSPRVWWGCLPPHRPTQHLHGTVHLSTLGRHLQWLDMILPVYVMSLICSYYCTPIEIQRRVTDHSLQIANYLEPKSRPKKLNHWSSWARVDTKVSRHYSESTLQRVDTTASRHYSKMILSLSQQYSESFWAWVGTTVNTTAS